MAGITPKGKITPPLAADRPAEPKADPEEKAPETPDSESEVKPAGKITPMEQAEKSE